MSTFFFIFLSNVLILAAAKRNFRFIALKAACDNKNSNVFESFNCFLEQGLNHTYGSGHIMFRFPVSQLMTRIEVDTKIRTGQRFKILNVYIDICNVLHGLKADRIFKIGLKILKRFMNEVPDCPVKAHFNYTILRAYLDEEDFPKYTPSGDFNLRMTLFHQNIEGAIFSYTGKVVAVS